MKKICVIKRKGIFKVILKFLFCDKEQKSQKMETILNLTWTFSLESHLFSLEERSVSQKNREILWRSRYLEPAKGKVQVLRYGKSKWVIQRAVNPIFIKFRLTKIKVQKKKERTYPVSWHVYKVLKSKNHHLASD